MNFKKNLKFFLTVVVLSATTAVRAEKHAFSPLDLVTFNRISSHSISPNYEYILYDVSKYNAKDNKKELGLYITNLKNNSTVQLTSKHSDFSPFWLNDKTIGFLSTRSGSSQLWYSTLDFDNLDLIKENKLKQLTKLTTSINNIEYNQKAKRLLFSAQAYLNGTLVNDDTYVEQEDNKYTTGIVYDKLFIRHWDTFLKPSV